MTKQEQAAADAILDVCKALLNSPTAIPRELVLEFLRPLAHAIAVSGFDAVAVMMSVRERFLKYERQIQIPENE
jgi:hypothetical protein